MRLFCRDLAQRGYRQASRIRVCQRTGEACRRRATGTTMLWVGVDCFYHAFDEPLARQLGGTEPALHVDDFVGDLLRQCALRHPKFGNGSSAN